MSTLSLEDISRRFVRAAEIDRASHEHVGPSPLRAQQLPYVHTYADKNGWGKAKERRVVKRGKLIQGDWLDDGDDPHAEERRAFFERMGMMPTPDELRDLDDLYQMLLIVGADSERRALLAWARAKAGGKAFRRWCFSVEGIHPETGRRRKDRALARIHAQLDRDDVQDCVNEHESQLQCGQEFGDVSGTLDEAAGQRDGLNSWMADDAFASVLSGEQDFSWAQKRWQVRRQREAAKRKKEAETA